ncbi:MAG: 3'(2'),5'-bisphosphate nucleotidase CysQ, partial [Gemmatimonadales bacterium]
GRGLLTFHISRFTVTHSALTCPSHPKSPMINQIIPVVESAGRLIQDVALRGFAVEQKGSQGPVTEADRESDELLKSELLAIESCGWLSEETADDRSRLDLERLWVVDPLDGTKEFVKRIPEYTVAVALVDAGRPVLGVVHNPATGDTCWAVKGAGAFKNRVRIHVADGATLLASRSEVRRGEFRPFTHEWEVTAVGSIEYKLALIGSGRASVTFSRGPKWEWDVCAGALIVEEAGGKVTDLFGGPLEFNQPFPKVKGVLAGAPEAYERARTQLGSVGASDRMGEFSEGM